MSGRKLPKLRRRHRVMAKQAKRRAKEPSFDAVVEAVETHEEPNASV